MNTVYCYDRFATLKRLGAAAFLIFGAGAVLATSLPAHAATKVEVLPRVVVTGKAVRPEVLPRVVVTGRAQPGAVLAQARKQPEGALQQVAYVRPAANF